MRKNNELVIPIFRRATRSKLGNDSNVRLRFGRTAICMKSGASMVAKLPGWPNRTTFHRFIPLDHAQHQALASQHSEHTSIPQTCVRLVLHSRLKKIYK